MAKRPNLVLKTGSKGVPELAKNRSKNGPQKWTILGVSIWDPLDVMFWRGFDPSEWTIWGIELPYKGIWSLRMVAGPGIRDPFWTPKWSILDHFWGSILDPFSDPKPVKNRKSEVSKTPF